MSEHRDHTRRLLRHYRSADDRQLDEGLTWYDRAHNECSRAAVRYGCSTERAACAIAHLSPRQRWPKNLELAELLLAGEPRPPWALTRSWRQAEIALTSDDPWETFGRRAVKTRSFARAILGDANAVVVDVWMARACGVSEYEIRSIAGYTAVADAVRRGSRRVNLAARDLQAVVWVVVRGSAS